MKTFIFKVIGTKRTIEVSGYNVETATADAQLQARGKKVELDELETELTGINTLEELGRHLIALG